LAGCPIQQEIEENFLPTASGEGLQFGRENKPTSFIVDTSGRSGDLSVNVDGNLSFVLNILEMILILSFICNEKMCSYKQNERPKNNLCASTAQSSNCL
jgi:hypothetical protein